jgi:hypothetical protein
MKRAIIGLFIASLSSAAAAQQRSPAQMGVNDSTKTWVTVGTVDPTTHTFTRVGGGGGGGSGVKGVIYTTDPDVGMVAGGSDNSSKLPALMSAIGPPSVYNGGYDVVFPGVPGQGVTSYYFSKSLDLSRNSRYRCSGSGGNAGGPYPSVTLVFAAGVDGVIQADGHYSPDGGAGGGSFSGCRIASQNYGVASAGAGAANLLNASFFNGDPNGGAPLSTWRIGDGIILVPNFAEFYADAVVPSAPHGAYINGISGSTLTLAPGFTVPDALEFAIQTFTQNGANNFVASDQMTVGNNTFTFVSGTPASGQIKVGADFNTTAGYLASAVKTNAADTAGNWGAPLTAPNFTAAASYNYSDSAYNIVFTTTVDGVAGDLQPATYTPAGASAGGFDAQFTPNGTNNFSNNDKMTIGNNTFRFVTGAPSAPGDVKIVNGSFAGTANDLIVAINGACTPTVCIAPSNAPNVKSLGYPPGIYPSGNRIQIHMLGGGGPTTYVPTGPSAGSFGATSFSGAGTVFVGGDLINDMRFFQLPRSQKYTVNTTLNSSSIAVTAGPRPLRSGDLLWSEAFPLGATVLNVSGNVFPQAANIYDAFEEAPLTASLTKAGGQMWTIPASLKREVTALADRNTYQYFPIGMLMSCSSAGNLNCTASTDRNNFYSAGVVGRWVSGNNTSPGSSYSEEFAGNAIADVMEGGTVGSNYYSINSNSNESSHGKYGVVGNCINQNYSTFFGGYIGGALGLPYCAAASGIVPPTVGGTAPMFIGMQAASPAGAPTINVGLFGAADVYGGWDFHSGVDKTFYAGTASTNWYTWGWSAAGGGTPNVWGWSWNSTLHSWDLLHWANELVMRYAATDNSYTGYAGVGTGVIFPSGVLLYNFEDSANAAPDARVLCMSATIPTATWHKKGDVCFNTNPTHGGNIGWTDMADGANFEAWGTLP